MRRERLYLEDIIDSIEKIQSFTAEMDFNSFIRDDKTKSAVIREFEIIGEAAKNISLEIKQPHIEIPWSDMAKMRDKLIHWYFGINYPIIWKTIQERLPVIKTDIRKILIEIKDD
jgi:uncharacterized protein with HEPN domain